MTCHTISSDAIWAANRSSLLLCGMDLLKVYPLGLCVWCSKFFTSFSEGKTDDAKIAGLAAFGPCRFREVISRTPGILCSILVDMI